MKSFMEKKKIKVMAPSATDQLFKASSLQAVLCTDMCTFTAL